MPGVFPGQKRPVWLRQDNRRAGPHRALSHKARALAFTQNETERNQRAPNRNAICSRVCFDVITVTAALNTD